MRLRVLSVCLALMGTLAARPASAQSTLFNIPSTDVVSSGSTCLEIAALFASYGVTF